MANSPPETPSHLKFGKRHVLVAWLFLGFVNAYIMRVCINTAIVSMVQSNGTSVITANTTDFSCPYPEPSGNGSSSREGEFQWDKGTQGVILSSFYYGYIGTQFIAGYLPRLIGGRLLYGIGITGSAVLTILHPVVARSSVQGFIVLRVLVGICLGVTFPCNSFLLANWVPKKERSTLASLSTAGTFVGTIIAAALTGVLCEYGFDGGWPTAFYVWGALGLLWSVGWFWVVRDSPDQHPTISTEERKYIEENCQSQSKPVPFTEIPWKSLLLSPPVWGVIIGLTAYTWNYYTLLTEMSTYLKDVQHISASLNGVITSIPYVCVLVLALISSFSADLVRAKGVPTKWVRKLWYGFGMIGSSIVLIVVGYAGCDEALVTVLLCIAVGIVGFAYSGVLVNNLDIAPQYAGIIMGISNTFGSIPGIVTPIVASYIVHDSSTIATWQIVFYISAGVSFAGAILFALLGDGEVQTWAMVAQPEPTLKPPPYTSKLPSVIDEKQPTDN